MTNKGNGRPPRPGTGPNAQAVYIGTNKARLRSQRGKKAELGAGELGGHCTAKRGAPLIYSHNKDQKQHQGDQKDTKMTLSVLPMGSYPRKFANLINPKHILIKTCPNPIIMQHILIILIILIFLKKKKGAGG